MNKLSPEAPVLEPIFIFPSIKNEMGEIERVAQHYAPNEREGFIQRFLEKSKVQELEDLKEEVWSNLENTDSYDIEPNGWSTVEDHISYTNKTSDATRDWQLIKTKMEHGEDLDAPIVLKHGNIYHLVSGNTRLMVARALGKTPKVLFVEI